MNNIKSKLFIYFGRSMIEMIGVIAIMGVISAGGVVGYSSVKSKNEVRQFIKDMATMNSQAATAYMKSPITGIKGPSWLCSRGILPQNYCKATISNYNISYSPFSEISSTTISYFKNYAITNGGYVNIDGEMYRKSLPSPSAAIKVDFTRIKTDKCVSLLSSDFAGVAPVVSFAVTHSDEVFYALPMSITNATNFCNGNDTTTLHFVFYIFGEYR